jgi:hypothetical protein
MILAIRTVIRISSLIMEEELQWIVVKHEKRIEQKPKRQRPHKARNSQMRAVSLDFDHSAPNPQIIHDRLKVNYESMTSSLLVAETVCLMDKFFSQLRHSSSKIIVQALGIGNISHSRSSQLQFAYFRHIIDHINPILKSDESYHQLSVEARLYDPLMSTDEVDLCEKYKILVDKANNKGKYVINSDSIYVYFMPHCPYQLYNNVIWSHWLSLERLIIIGNRYGHLGR